MNKDRILVTGGGGFIGSHLTEYLLKKGNQVTVVDDFSVGREEWIPEDADIVEGDLRYKILSSEILSPDFDLVIHTAAATSVRTSMPRKQFESNNQMTFNVLDAMRINDVDRLAFTSSSTVYGEAPRPTPEDYGPLEPISIYGASKAADEALCAAFGNSHDIEVKIFRFANIVGPRLREAVIPDFIQKLQENPDRLKILGNGKQEKSYMHVSDCVDAIFTALEHKSRRVDWYNLGTRTTTSVDEIAEIVSNELGCTPEYDYTGGERGWTGDVSRMHLSVEKLAGLGWDPTLSSTDAVRQATRELITEFA